MNSTFELSFWAKQVAGDCRRSASTCLTHMFTLYKWLLSFADPRVEQWFLMKSPLPTLLILCAYLAMITYGPRWMKRRQAFELRWIMFTYNSLISTLNAWIAGELLYCGLKRNYNFTCQLVDFSNNQYELRVARAIWWYYASKAIEFADSLFFVLRKKTDQLSFLHVYHHSTMFAFWWVGAKFVPGGTALSAAMVNCFVHVLMYTYYAIAALQLRPLLGWKRQLTLLQLVQFSVGVLLGIRAIVTNCQFTRWMQYFFVCYAFSFILLFGQFYRRTYGRSSSISSTACTAISSHSKTKVDPPGGEIERTYNKHTDHKKKKIVKKKSKMIRIDSKKRTKTKSSPQSS